MRSDSRASDRTLITLERVSPGYDRAIFPPVTLTVRGGDFLGIVGPNGSGKTTLVRTMLGLLPPIEGEVRRATSLACGYVPQREVVERAYPLTACEVVLMGRYGRLGFARRPAKADVEAARRALVAVGAGDLVDAAFHALSGGQRQRVLVARALAGDPDLLVLDEPTAGLDLPSERDILELLHPLTDRGLAVIMVSHQLGAVADYASELCLVPGGGRVVEVGSRGEILTSERLTAIYGQPVIVATVAGHAAIFTDGRVA